jgi:hypothetical protein
LGRRQRGLTFLAMTAVLVVVFLVALSVPQLLMYLVFPFPGIGPVVFILIWLLQTYDLYTLTKKPAL